MPHLIAFAMVLLWLAALALRARRGGPPLARDVDVSRIQALQPAVQLTILVYWSVYWTELRHHASWIVLHVAFCYLVDAAWSWTTGRRWRVTLGVLPVVFSVNLFLYYDPEHMLLAYLLYVVAFGGKALVQRDGGRHVFNPSALGMSVMLLGGYAQLWSLPHEVDHAFLLPPNIIEVLFLISLIGQLRIPIVFTTLGAYGALSVNPLGLVQGVSAFYPSSFIAILLLITDPRTSPRNPVAQLLYGAIYGLSYQLLTDVSTWLVGHDGSAKVLAVLPANLLVPACERAGIVACRYVDALFDPSLYRVWVASWVITIVGTWGMHPERKQGMFDMWVPDHERSANPWIVRDADGRVTCKANPVFCEPFSFPGEIRMWLDGTQDGLGGAPPMARGPE